MEHALTSYRSALDALYARTTGQWKLGLGRTRALLAALGDPQDSFRSLHVAGTNGKGSVCATLAALLGARGRRVAKYTSPHLVDFRERFVIDGRSVEESAVLEFMERAGGTIDALGATFFEATTALAFDLFARAGVDVAVVETGLGGRLDATNVIAPLVAGVTNVGIDHVAFLGETRERIAAEKAGIFKHSVPAVIGEPEPEVRALLARFAREASANPIISVAEDYAVRNVRVESTGTRFSVTHGGTELTLRTPLLGEYQAQNTATALAMLRASGLGTDDESIALQAKLDQVSLAGRFQLVGDMIFDVAHNPDGVRALAQTLRITTPQRPLTALACMMGDKDWRSALDVLAPLVDRFVLTIAPSAPATRVWDLTAVSAHARARSCPHQTEPEFGRALDLARRGSATTLVTGSFHTVGDAMARLQVDPLAP